MGVFKTFLLRGGAVLTLSLTAVATTASPALARADAVRSFDIPAGSLGAAIARLGRQAGIMITAEPVLVRGVRTSGLRGAYTSDKALAALLDKTGLVARSDGRGGYVVARNALSAPHPAKGAPATPRSQLAREPAETDVDAVVVTAASVATLGQTSILETPRTIQAIGANLIANITPTSLQEVTKLLPTLTPRSGYADPQQQLMIRGVSLGTSDYRRDGLSLRHAFMPIEEVEQIEVLQGVVDVTQAGEKSPGGVINFVPKRPTGQDFQRYTVGLNEYGDALAHADINQGFADGRYGVRANLVGERIDLADKTSGSRYAAALAFRARVTPDILLDLNGYYQDQSRDHVSDGYLPTITGASGSAALPKASYGKDYGQSWSRDHYKRGVVEAKLSGDLGDGWSFIAQGHVVRYDFNSLTPSLSNLQADGAVNITAVGFPSKVRDAAARVAVTKDIEISSSVHNRFAVILDSMTDSLDYAYAGQSVGTGNIHGDLAVAAPTFTVPGLGRGNDLRVNGAGFNDELTLFDRLTVTAGAKWVDLRSRSYWQGALDNEAVIRKWLPNVSALYRITPRWTVYGTYNEAVQAGGIVQVSSGYANAGETLPPLLSKSYEAGTKLRAGGVLASVSAFSFTQPSQIIVNNAVTNSGATRYQGLDINVSGQLTPRLNVIAAADFLDAEVRRTDDASVLGKTPSNVPSFTSSLYLDYEARPGLFLSGGAFHVSRKPVDDQNTTYVPGYTTFDLGARYVTDLVGRKTTFRLGVTNLTDKFYWASALFSRLQYGAPRMIKGSITIEY